jgi:hypothetical protein
MFPLLAITQPATHRGYVSILSATLSHTENLVFLHTQLQCIITVKLKSVLRTHDNAWPNHLSASYRCCVCVASTQCFPPTPYKPFQPSMFVTI